MAIFGLSRAPTQLFKTAQRESREQLVNGTRGGHGRRLSAEFRSESGLFREVRVEFASLRSGSFEHIRAERLAAEVGTIHKQATRAIALCYPSPYAVGMSSLGFQTIYRLLNAHARRRAERAFLPDDAQRRARAREPLRTYESGRPVGDFPIVAFSLAYELELAGLVELPGPGRASPRSPRSAPRGAARQRRWSWSAAR